MEPKTSAQVCGMGHSMKRKEDPRFIRGRGNYVDDIQLPGMLHMDIVRSPFAHAKIKSINADKALKVPGVLAVITGETLAKYNLHWMPTLMSDTQMVLPTEKVMYQAFAQADVVVKQDMYIPRIHVASIETCGCVADFDRVTGKLTVYMTTQAPHAIRTVFALVAGHVGLSEEKIRIVSPDIGGGF